MRRENSEFKTSFVSEAGSLPVNKDYFGFVEMDDFACYVVADGLDTDREVYAAKVAVDYVLTCFTSHPSLSAKRMKRYLREASKLLRKESEHLRLKASIMVVLTDYMRVRYVMAGNTRLYLFRGQKVIEKSKDQSFYQNDINLGKIPDDGSREFEERNNLLQYLGQPKPLKPFSSKKLRIQDNDILLIASCGLWEQLGDIEIIDAMETCKEPIYFVEDLQDLLLSKKKENQFVGNYTAAAIFINKLFKKPDNRKKIIRLILMIGIPLLVIGIVLGIVFWKSNKTWKENKFSVIELEEKANDYTNDLDYSRAQAEYAKAIEESANLKQTNGKKGKENKQIKQRLSEKERIVQLIADGDEAIENGKYSTALKKYKEALKALRQYSGEEIDLDDINEIDVQEKMDRCQKLLDIENQVKLADLKAANGDYAGAAQDYAQAKQSAISQDEQTLADDLQLKQAEAETKAKGSQNDAKKNEGMALESAGDIAASQNAYDEANAKYRQAAAAYGAAGYPEGVASVNGKIAQMESKVAADAAATQAEAEKTEQQAKEEQEKQQAEAEKNKSDAAQAAQLAKEEEEKELIAALKAEARRTELEGDTYARNQDYESAYDSYESAYNLYSEVGMSEKAQLLAQKMTNMLSKQEKREQQLQSLTANDWENLGDQAMKNDEYGMAIAYYETAQSMYGDANRNDKALQVDEKLKNAKEVKEISEQPTPTPEPTPEPTPTPIVILLPLE